MIYFDNGATSQKPQSVIDAISTYYSKDNSNIHRGVHYLSQLATTQYEEARKTIQKYINAEYEDEVLFTKGTTDGINLIANGFRTLLNKGDEVVISEMEHHSNIVPWQMLCERKGCVLRVIPITQEGELKMDEFHSFLSEKRQIIFKKTDKNYFLTLNPVEEIIESAHAAGAKVLIDAAQGAPHVRIDFDAFGADFMAFSAHKMCGPTGIGALLVRPDAFQEMQPFMGGGDMIETVTTEGSTYQENEHKFEAGTPRIAEAIGWNAAFGWMESLDLEKEHKRMLEIARYTAKELRGMGMTVYGRHDDGDSAVVSFLHPKLHSEDMAHLLDAVGYAVRTGHHCAQPLLHRLGITSTVRASYYFYNTMEEAEKFIAALKRSVNMLL